MRSHARLAAVLYLTAVGAYLLDRLTKLWAENQLQGRAPIELIGSTVRLDYTTNSGGAFGIGGSAPLLFAGASLVVVGVIVWTSFRLPRIGVAIGLGLVLGGALGNLTDRIVRGPGVAGSVVDFIDVGPWPVFNLADSAIVIGAILLAFGAFRHARDDDPSPPTDTPEHPGAGT